MVIFFIINIFICLISCYILYKAKVNHEQQSTILQHLTGLTEQKKNKLIELQNQLNQYQNSINHSRSQLQDLHSEQQKLNNELTEKEHNIQKYYNMIEKQAKIAFNNYEEQLDNQYNKIEKEFNTQIKQITARRDSVQKDLDQLKSTYDAATAAYQKEQAESKQWKYYSINISDDEADDIEQLQKWKKSLHDPSIVSKIIWSTYIMKPTSDLCNRVVGTEKTCGIYKITNKLENKVYIGQSVDITNRIKTHIKCGLGIDTPPASANKLYRAMQQSILWYWTFEVLEKCPSNKLNEKERYWINFYQSDKIGYNATKGVINSD